MQRWAFKTPYALPLLLATCFHDFEASRELGAGGGAGGEGGGPAVHLGDPAGEHQGGQVLVEAPETDGGSPEPMPAAAGAAGAEPEPRGVCTADDWCWVHPLPQGNSLQDLWVAGPDDVWAVGYGGTLIRYKDGVWHNLSIDTFEDPTKIWGTSASDVFVTTLSGAVLHWDGEAWESVASITSGSLWGLGGAGKDVWASGFGGTILHYDGEAWRPVANDSSAWLMSLVAVSPTVAFAAGNSGTVVRLDGGEWKVIQETDEDITYYSVWATSTSNAWAFGLRREADTVRTIASRWDGGSWKTSEVDTYEDAWGTPDGRVWVVGSLFLGVSHWDGSQWQSEAVEPAEYLSAIHGRDADDIWAAGMSGAIYRRNDGRWQPVSSGTDQTITANAFWTDGPHGFAVGYGMVLRKQGAEWRREDSGAPGELWGAWSHDARELWAVGDLATIVRERGHGWEAVAVDAPAIASSTLYAIDGSAADDAWAVGEGGTILHYGGEAWQLVPSPTQATLRAVWAPSRRLAWAVGEGGVALRWEGAEWLPVASGTGQSLSAVHGRSPTDVWAVGALGTLLHWNGQEWLPKNLGGASDLFSVVVEPHGDVWIGGDMGALWQIRNGALEPRQSGTYAEIVSLRALPGSVMFIDALGGILSHRIP